MTEQYRKYINEENNREFHGDLGGVGQGGGDSPVMWLVMMVCMKMCIMCLQKERLYKMQQQSQEQTYPF